MTSIREATKEDALSILQIRNEVRRFMTRSRSEISVDEQLTWFSQTEENGYSLYAVVRDATVIGYGLLHIPTQRLEPVDGAYGIAVPSEGKVTELRAALTGAVAENLRGRGYGRLIFSYLLAEAWIKKAQPWLEVYETNAAAFALYYSLGFRETGRQGSIITMMHFR